MKINYKKKFISIGISIATISDTRNNKTDKSGKILEKKILKHGHNLIEKKIITDDTKEIMTYFNQSIMNSAVNAIITTGGSGLTDRASTIQSRAKAGISKGKFLFCLPGSPSACADAWDNILKFQLDSRFEPCNLIDLMPRISDK
jgi:molybdenum cofactor biosynthesis protein B